MDILAALILGFVASMIGAIAAGGGLISIPGMVFLGLSPISAIATTRLNVIGGGFTASLRYYRNRSIITKHFLPLLVLALIAGVVGPKLLLLISAQHVQKVLGATLLISAPFLLSNKDFGAKDVQRTTGRQHLGYPAFFFIMLYSTMFAAGGGIFMIEAFIYFFGMDVTESNATGTALNWIATTVALVTYIHSGAVNWHLGIPLLLGAILGGYVGASLAIERGVAWVKFVLVAVVITSSIKLIFF